MVYCRDLIGCNLPFVAALRLVCRRWRAAVGECFTELHPSGAQPARHLAAFPAVRSLDLMQRPEHTSPRRVPAAVQLLPAHAPQLSSLQLGSPGALPMCDMIILNRHIIYVDARIDR